MTPPIPRPALKNTVIGFKPEPPDTIVVDAPEEPMFDESPGRPEPSLTDSPAFVLLLWTLIGLVVGIAWTL